YSRNTVGAGSATKTLTRGATSTIIIAIDYIDTQGGNYLDGQPRQTLTGIDRYFALEHFTDTSDPGLTVPGTLDFSPVGLPLFTGQGPTVPTGGGPVALNPQTVDAVFSDLAQPAGPASAGDLRGSEADGAGAIASGADSSAATSLQ